MASFTYYLLHKPTGKKYYGVRTARGCHPDDLWNTYFSSSKLVKELIEVYGKESFYFEVRRIFKNKRDALLWERKVLIKLQASQSENWLNQNNGGGAGSHTDETREKIKSNNAKYWKGVSRPDISEKFKGHKVTEETRKKLSDKLKGRRLSEETKNKMKKRIPWNKGKKGLQIPWNKGLTANIDERVKLNTEKITQTIKRKRLYENLDRTESNSNS